MSSVRYYLGVFLVSSIWYSVYALSQPIQLVNAFPNLTFTKPLFLTHSNDGTNRIFVVQQNGLIQVFPNDSAVTSYSTFLDISSKISSSSGEEGLLGLAFHPQFKSNGYFFVNYTALNPRRTVVARYSVDRSHRTERIHSVSLGSWRSISPSQTITAGCSCLWRRWLPLHRDGRWGKRW
jgi:hypothetical protein